MTQYISFLCYFFFPPPKNAPFVWLTPRSKNFALCFTEHFLLKAKVYVTYIPAVKFQQFNTFLSNQQLERRIGA
jgi:hypothetical protein